MGDKMTETQLTRAIEGRIADLVRNGALNTSGVDTLFEQVTKEFAENLQALNYPLTKDQFLEKVEKLVWTEGQHGTLAALEGYVRWGMDPASFRQLHPYISLEMIQEKYRELRGITNILHPISQNNRFVRGIWRFAGSTGLKGNGKFELSSTSFGNPYEIPVKSQNWTVSLINGLNLGLPHSHLISENPARQALAQAEHDKCDAVVMTNIFDVETRKAAGPSRVLQGLLSGITVHVEALDPEYQEEAKRLLAGYVEERQQEQNFTNGESPEHLYITAAEIFAHLMRALRKIAFKTEKKAGSEKKPEYSGNIYIVLGVNDERLITAAAYGEIHYNNLVKQHQLQAQAKAASSATHRITRERKKIESRRTQLQAEGNDEGLQEALKQITQDLERVTKESESIETEAHRIMNLLARARITNVSPEEWQLYYNRALAFFVRSLEDEDVLPNCKVIGKGTTYVKLGEEMIKLVIPNHTNVRDTLLSEYTNRYAPEALRDEMADVTVICHPYALGGRFTAREADHQGRRRAVKVCVAPMCVDTKFLREKLREIVHATHPIQKSALSALSSSGILYLNCIDRVTNITEFPLEALTAFERYAKKTHRAKATYTPKYIWIDIATDQHWGAKSKEFVTCKVCKVKLGMSDAVFHALRHAGYNNTDRLPPVHVYAANDDVTQGHHFPAEEEPHPHELSYREIQQEMWDLLEASKNAKTSKRREELQEKLVEFALYQFLVRGVYCTTDQVMIVLKDYLQPNVDMFDGILRRALKSGIILRGVSAFAQADSPYMRKDRRDVGFINFGTGNHFLRTTNGTLSEGPIYAELLKAHLLQYPFWQDKKEIVDLSVRGPTYGKEFIAWGTIQAPGGYEWGLDFRNTPPGRGVDWGDPLRIAVNNDLRRGNYARMHEGKVTLKTYGDKHFLSFVRTSHALYLMGPPGAHTDLYGELGFPPNNTGVVFIGLPAEGPDAGPILIRALLYDDIRDIVQDHPRIFDWEKFFPNPL